MSEVELMKEEVRLVERTVLYCEHCDDIVDSCKECGGYFEVGEIVYCDGDNHYHRHCIEQKQDNKKLKEKN
jgi:hypothetical protein